MCKFNNYLFIIIFIIWPIIVIHCHPFQNDARPAENNALSDLLALSFLAAAPRENYNLHYDQRQKGNENYRLKLDGFFISLPQEDDSALLLLTEELLENLGNNESKPETDLSSSSASSSASSLAINSKPEMVVVEIPSVPKQQYQEARNSFISPYGANNDNTALRPKSYLYRLLNMLKHSS